MTDAPPPTTSRNDQAKLIAAGVAVLLVVLLAAVNSDKVEVDWIVGSSRTPLVIVIVASFLLGAAAGALAVHRRR